MATEFGMVGDININLNKNYFEIPYIMFQTTIITREEGIKTYNGCVAYSNEI